MSAVDQKKFPMVTGGDADYEELMLEGKKLLSELDYSAALKVFDRALKLAQKKTGEEKVILVAQARNHYADCCHVIGRWDRAQRELRRTIESELDGDERIEVARALLTLGNVLSRRGERDEAKDHFVEALEVGKELEAPRIQVVAYCHLAANSGRTGEIDSANRHLEDASRVLNELASEDIRAERALLESQYGLYFFRTGNNNSAEDHFESALAALDGKKILEEGAIRRYLGIQAGMRRDHREALNNHLEGLKVYKEAGCRYGQAKVYDSIGRTFLAVNRMEEAIFSFKKAESICRRLGANSELATLYGKLGQVYMIREDYETAVKYFRRDLDISSRFRNYYALGYSYRNLGRSLIQVGIMEEAITNLKESLGLFQYVEDQINLGRVYMDLTQAYVKHEKASEARDSGHKARSIFEEAQLDRELAFLKALFGTINRLEGNLEEAETCLTEAIDELPDKGFDAWRAETHYELGILYREQEKYPEAISAFRYALGIARAAGLNRHTGRYLRDIESLDETELFRAWMEDLPD